MANQKVKHIIAKLVGQSTESTLDVYDVDAVHTDKIANNLTTTSSGYVLDARQGKALNDSLVNLVNNVAVKRIAFEDSPFNDSLRYAIGYVTDNGVSLNIFIPVPIRNAAASINTTRLMISLRTPSGGILGGSAFDGVSKIVSQNLTAQGITYLVTLSTSVTPNTIYLGAVRITCTFS